jgi:hypothetical protein
MCGLITGQYVYTSGRTCSRHVGTGGKLANKHKTEWEKDIAARMVGTNNAAESPFATVRALLHIYPR